MDIFNHLPASVLQWFAIFISIIIEALPFVLLGTILSGFIEVYVTPDLVQRYLPKINSYEFSLEPSLVLFFLPVNVGLFLSSRAF